MQTTKLRQHNTTVNDHGDQRQVVVYWHRNPAGMVCIDTVEDTEGRFVSVSIRGQNRIKSEIEDSGL